MSRLTWRNPEDGKIYLYGENADVVGKLADYEDLEEQCIAENQCGIREILLKWKEFFDDIAELYDYRKAEEQGLLLRLPVPIGTPVYRVVQDCGGDTLECRCGDCKDCEDLHRFVVEIKFEIYMLDSIGKSIFLTREEAESALAEKGGAECVK